MHKMNTDSHRNLHLLKLPLQFQTCPRLLRGYRSFPSYGTLFFLLQVQLQQLFRNTLIRLTEKVQLQYIFLAVLVLAKQIFVILRDMELIPDMEIYREVFFILRNETLNGRHVCELLEDMCKTEEMIPDMERAEQIFSYRDYPYMKKRWEKFCRHSAIAGTETLKWEEEMECFHHFLGDMWEAVCRDEVFFGDWMPELARFLG